ncbi:MAG: DJ-1/PfpI family protein [Helicobacteraceae bacterium]|jgi:4-methyl-5(b-hydroxyethyl)-thiazole monophosphate biosynthesis|nr:DJ-1/PfpI family protein [Helicobacteraceae bacterium]
MGKKALMPLANGFEEIEAITIVDILRRAGVEVEIAGLGRYEILGAHGIAIGAESTIEDAEDDEFDLIVLAGGHENAMSLAADMPTQRILSKMRDGGKLIAAICAAPIALAQAGVIDGDFTCYGGYEGGIEGNFKRERVVENKNVITSQGPGTAADFAFALVTRLKGAEMTAQLKRAMYFA